MAGGGKCSACRGGRVIEPRESDYRYWLTMFGVTVPQGAKALDVVRAAGIPSGLRTLAEDFDREFSGD